MITEDDERWARYVTFPALVLALPLYVVSTAYYIACRESFGLFLDFLDSCEGTVLGQHHEHEDAA